MLTKKGSSTKNEVKGSKTTKTPSPTFSTSSPAKPGPSSPKTYTTPPSKPQIEGANKKSTAKTRITVKYDVGYPNQLYIRGKGGNLNWEKGQPLKNAKSDEWVWESDGHFSHCEFKILINDQVYECGENRLIQAGANLLYTPSFS